MNDAFAKNEQSAADAQGSTPPPSTESRTSPCAAFGAQPARLCSWCLKNMSDRCSVSGSADLCTDCADELADDNAGIWEAE